MRLRFFLFILSCYVVFFVATPPFMLNDEPDHFQYVYWLSKGVFPKMPLKSGVFAFDKQISNIYDVVEVASNDYNIPNFAKIKRAISRNAPFLTKRNQTPFTYQVHHPPLYFVSSLLFFLPASFLFKGIIPVYYATRLTSTIFYFFSVYTAYLIALKILKKQRDASYLASAFAVNPVVLKMGIAVNPDIASTCISMLALYFFISLLKRPTFSWMTLIRGAVITGVSGIVKFQNIALLPFTALFFLIKGVWAGNWKKFLAPLFLLPSLAFFFILPWIIHSLFTYQSITPSARAYTFFCTANLAPVSGFRIPFETLFELRHAFFHFAGFLGWGEPYPFKIFFYSYTFIFIFLIALGIYRLLKTKDRYMMITGLFALFVTLFFLGVSFTYKINRYSCDIQGRYLLSALFPFMLFAYSGLRLVLKKRKDDAAYYVFLFAAWQFYFILFLVLIPRYYV